MLTADLARSREDGDTIRPLFIDPDDEQYRETARTLLNLFEAHLGEPKGDLDDAIEELTVADTDYKIIQGLAKLLRDESEFTTVAPKEPREIRRQLFEKANNNYPIARNPSLGDDTHWLDIVSGVADELGLSLEECAEGMYADLDANQRLVRVGTWTADGLVDEESADGTATTQLTGQSSQQYRDDDLTVDWLLNRYNLALAQAVLYDAVEMQIRVWDHFSTVFSYMKLFGLMHRIYPIDEHGNRVPTTDHADGYEAVLDGPASLFSQTRKYGIRMANFLPALPLCDRWEATAEIAVDDTARKTKTLALDHSEPLSSHYSGGDQFDSDIERTLADKWARANTEWELLREADVLDLGDEVMLPDFALEHPNGQRAILEIVGFWTPEYLSKKLAKIQSASVDNLLVAVSERLDCADEDFGEVADQLLWFKTGIHVYDVVELAETVATPPSETTDSESQ